MHHPESSKLFEPFAVYSSVNKPVMVLVIAIIAFLGLAFFVGAFRMGIGRMGADEWFLACVGLGFLGFSWYMYKFVFSLRVLIERDYFYISDFFRCRRFYYEQILAMAEFERLMRQRSYTRVKRSIPVLAIRLRSGELIQFALPDSHDNQACLDALAETSGVVIESLGIDPPKIQEWQRNC